MIDYALISIKRFSGMFKTAANITRNGPEPVGCFEGCVELVWYYGGLAAQVSLGDG
jgi:hypothetical protein